MTFSIPTPNGDVCYRPSRHTRDDLKFAFKKLRKAGHGNGSILLGALFCELYPAAWDRLHKRWLKANFNE